MTKFLWDGPRKNPLRLVLAHGAGAGMNSPFMRDFARALSGLGVSVVRFEFPYMARRKRGAKSAPDRAPVLLESYREVARELGRDHSLGALYIGGKSMGGRMASMVADELGVRGVVCLGYPFHPPGRLEQTRTAHLTELRTRCLIVQGTRDPFGTPEEVAAYELSSRIRVHWIDTGDHSLAPLRSSGGDARATLLEAAEAAAAFMGAEVTPRSSPAKSSKPRKKSPRKP
jgi:predicted alpha/beta-hydrolase family hydrolase